MPISCIICLFHAQFIFDCPNIGFYFDFRSPFGLLPSDFGVHHIGRVRSGIEEVIWVVEFPSEGQRYTYRVLQTIQMKLMLLCVWAEWAGLGSAKTALKFNMKFK
jgi:hypothetical protein